MAIHTATVSWEKAGATFIDNRYSRAHRWSFAGGLTVPASVSPHVVPVPLSEPANIDPEEAFVAALSSCHMLWFLLIAAKRGFVVDSYTDQAVGRMQKDERDRLAMTRIALRPVIRFGGEKHPSASEVRAMHDEAHHLYSIANSVRTEVVIESE
jgi:organic hydroperoxide reductase OsmC/OhrA